MKTGQLIGVILVVLSMSGCGTFVTHHQPNDPSQPHTTVHEVGEVKMAIAPEAHEDVAEYEQFSINELHRYIITKLAEKEILIVDPNLPKLEVQVTNVRIRSGITSAMFGIFSGVDNISGNVIIRDSLGKELDRFEVSSNYGWGGWAGSQLEIRMGYLYDAFASSLAEELGKK